LLLDEALQKISVVEVHHHTYAFGATHALSEFLIRRAGYFVLVEHPFMHHRFRRSRMIAYQKGRKMGLVEGPRMVAPEIVLFAKDLLLTIFFLLRSKRRFILYIGADPLNATAGLFLKRLGFAKVVVFYVIDYTPIRFISPIRNILYHWLRIVSTRKADFVWNISKRIWSLNSNLRSRGNMLVPSGVYASKQRQLSMQVSKRGRILLFVGHLDRSKGVQLAVEAMPLIMKAVGDVRLKIVGTGPMKHEIEKQITRNRLERWVELVGYMPNYEDVLSIMASSTVGLAPYVPDPTNISIFADPAKPKEYLASGVPVIITAVPEIAHEIARSKAGVIIGYDKQELAEAAINLLTNPKLYDNCVANAIKLAKEYEWDNIFQKATKEIIHAPRETGELN